MCNKLISFTFWVIFLSHINIEKFFCIVMSVQIVVLIIYSLPRLSLQWSEPGSSLQTKRHMGEVAKQI